MTFALCFLLTACAHSHKCEPAIVPPVEVPARIDPALWEACQIAPDDGTEGGYREALARALRRCQDAVAGRM